MKCPKCERGTIKKIIIKQNRETASLCDFCEMFWLEGEDIRANTGHPFDVLTQGDTIEYLIESKTDKDQDSTSIEYIHAK